MSVRHLIAVCLVCTLGQAKAQDAVGVAASDVHASLVIAVPAEALSASMADLEVFRSILPADCALDWTMGPQTAGLGATANVRYQVGSWTRVLDVAITRVTPTVVDLDHQGRRGFVTRFTLSADASGGTLVELTTYLNAPPWPFGAYFRKRVQPGWSDCYSRALDALAARSVPAAEG